jgi:hypothetical protein
MGILIYVLQNKKRRKAALNTIELCQEGDLLVYDNGNKINDPANTEQAAGNDPQNTDYDTGGVTLGDAIQAAVNAICKNNQQEDSYPRKGIQRLSQFLQLFHNVYPFGFAPIVAK